MVVGEGSGVGQGVGVVNSTVVGGGVVNDTYVEGSGDIVEGSGVGLFDSGDVMGAGNLLLDIFINKNVSLIFGNDL